MIAILFNRYDGRVIGYNYDVAACLASGASFIEVSELPQALLELQPNQQMRYEDGTFIVSTLPPEPPSEIELLRKQVQQLSAALGDLLLDGGI